MRQFGQQVIETLAGKRIHPGWVVPGGVNEPLSVEKRDKLLAQIPEVIAIAQKALAWFKIEFEKFREEIRTFANFPAFSWDWSLQMTVQATTKASCGLPTLMETSWPTNWRLRIIQSISAKP